MKNTKESTKIDMQLFMKIAALIAFLIFLYHGIAPMADLPEPSVNTIYWFLLILVALIFPYIREITFKDFSLLFQEMKESKQMLLTAKNELDEARLRFDKTREELILGYYEYLKSLPKEKQIEKKLYLTKLYIEGMPISEHEFMNMLNKVPGIKTEVTESISDNTIKLIEQFQMDFGLIADGIFGYQTYARLLELTR